LAPSHEIPRPAAMGVFGSKSVALVDFLGRRYGRAILVFRGKSAKDLIDVVLERPQKRM
jgi:hypothetical protein